MVRGPDTSHALVQTCDRFLRPLELFATGFLQEVGLLQDLCLVHISNTDGLYPPVDVLTLNNRVSVWFGRDADLNLRVGFCECGEIMFQERAASNISRQWDIFF